MKKEKRLQIVSDVIKQVKAKITSSNDIIPSEELDLASEPFREDKREKYEEKFGKEKMAEFQKYDIALKNARRFYSVVYEKCKEMRCPSPSTLATLITIDQWGVGECHETSYLAYNLLLKDLKEHKDDDFSVYRLLLVKNSGLLAIAQEAHWVVVIGDYACEDISSEIELPAFFSQFSADSILIDPFLGRCGLVQDFKAINGKYLEQRRIRYCMNYSKADKSFSDQAKMSLLLASQAELLVSMGIRERIERYQRALPEAKESPLASALQELSIVTQKKESSDLIFVTQLNRITRNKWVYYKKGQYAHLRGTPANLEEIKKYLERYAVACSAPKKIKDSADYLLIVSNFDPLKLLSAPEMPVEREHCLVSDAPS